MKFSKRLLEKETLKYKEFHIAYRDLKKAIKLITGADTSAGTIRDVTANYGNTSALVGGSFRPPENRFQDLLNHELEKVNKFATEKLRSINTCLSACSEQLKLLPGEVVEDPEALNLLFSGISVKLDEQAEELIFLESFQRLNFTGFRKITKKFDKNNKSSASSWYMVRLLKQPFMTLPLCETFTALSKVYLLLKEKKSELSRTSENALLTNNPTGLVEPGTGLHSTKYLIHPDAIWRAKVLILKYAGVLENSPIRSGFGVVSSDEAQSMQPRSSPERDWNQKQGGCRLNYVYFDNKSFDYYHSMVQNPDLKGTTRDLPIRLRWYGSSEEKNLIAIETFFPDEASIRDIERTDVIPETKFVDEECIKQLIFHTVPQDVTGDKILEITNISDAIIPMDENFSGPERIFENENVELSNLRKRIATEGLMPRIRVEFDRTSFRDESTKTFINIDEAVRFRRVKKDTWIGSKHSTSKGDNEYVYQEFDSVPLHWAVLDISHFSKFSVFSSVNSIAELLPVTEIKGFSIFAHSVGCLYEKKLNNIPDWLPVSHVGGSLNSVSLENKISIKDGMSCGNQDFSRRPDVCMKHRPSKIDVIYTGASSRLTHEQEATLQRRFSDRGKSNMASGRIINNNLGQPLLGNVSYIDANINNRESTCEASWGSVQNHRYGSAAFRNIFRKLRGWFSTRKSLQNSTVMPSSIRVEPKTFFANERTLLQWMNTSVLLCTISITLLRFGTQESGVAGLIMAPVALFFIGYSFYVFLKRSYSLERKQAINYNDRFGPSVLVICLIVAMTSVLFLNARYGGLSRFTVEDRNRINHSTDKNFVTN